MLYRTINGVAVVVLALAVVSCAGPQGRIMEDSEQDHVGARAAGAAAFDRLVTGSVSKLLGSHHAAHAGAGKLKVAVLRIDNASAEELGDWQEQIFDLISTSVNQSGRYETVSVRYVDAALRETRLRRDDLFLPAKRRQFLGILERDDNPAQVLLFPKLSSGTTRGDGIGQRNYLLTLELVDVASGKDYRVAERIRKAYRR